MSKTPYLRKHIWVSYYLMTGTLSFVGVPSSKLSTVHIGMLLSNRLRIMGSPIGGREMTLEMLKTAAQLGIIPVIEKFSADQVNEAIAKVRANKIRYRAVLEF